MLSEYLTSGLHCSLKQAFFFFKKTFFSFILCIFHVMHLDFIHFRIPSYLSLPLQHPPPNKIKFKRKNTKKGKTSVFSWKL